MTSMLIATVSKLKCYNAAKNKIGKEPQLHEAATARLFDDSGIIIIVMFNVSFLQIIIFVI